MSTDFFIQYTFPPQSQVVSACAELAQRLSTLYPQPERSNAETPTVLRTAVTPKNLGKVLMVIGSVFPLLQRPVFAYISPRTYSVGKERVVSGEPASVPNIPCAPTDPHAYSRGETPRR